MIDVSAEWKTYCQGERVKCPGRRLGSGRRAHDRGPERRQECRRIFVRVGLGETYQVRWLGDREHPIRVATQGSTMECWDCHALVEVQVHRAPAPPNLPL